VVQPCRICDEPATNVFGSYHFCDRHYQRATRQRGGVWQADLLSFAVLIAFVILVFVIDEALDLRLRGTGLLFAGAIIAIVPAIIWLAFFYRRDRLEPEPKGMVLGVFLLGALVAAAIGIPLVDEVFDVGSWLDLSLMTQILGGILVIGFTQETLKYLAVRLSVYQSREFDEWTDGILYGTAAGLGYATMLNIDFIAASGGADLGLASIRVALTALVHASLGGLMGYFLGRDRLEVRPAWWVPLGVAIAAVLNGLYFYLRSSFSGGAVGPIPNTFIGLALALLLAVAVTVVLVRVLERELRRARAAAIPSAASVAAGDLP
jgi:RsiW-degrading membrane proteinase PrsW (M82 family)